MLSEFLFQKALDHFNEKEGVSIENEHVKKYAEELCYCYLQNKELIDFDFWTRYEELLGERLSFGEYQAIDMNFDLDPHDVSPEDKTVLEDWKKGWEKSLKAYRKEQEVVANVQVYNVSKVSEDRDSVSRTHENFGLTLSKKEAEEKFSEVIKWDDRFEKLELWEFDDFVETEYDDYLGFASVKLESSDISFSREQLREFLMGIDKEVLREMYHDILTPKNLSLLDIWKEEMAITKKIAEDIIKFKGSNEILEYVGRYVDLEFHEENSIRFQLGSAYTIINLDEESKKPYSYDYYCGDMFRNFDDVIEHYGDSYEAVMKALLDYEEFCGEPWENCMNSEKYKDMDTASYLRDLDYTPYEKTFFLDDSSKASLFHSAISYLCETLNNQGEVTNGRKEEQFQVFFESENYLGVYFYDDANEYYLLDKSSGKFNLVLDDSPDFVGCYTLESMATEKNIVIKNFEIYNWLLEFSRDNIRGFDIKDTTGLQTMEAVVTETLLENTLVLLEEYCRETEGFNEWVEKEIRVSKSNKENALYNALVLLEEHYEGNENFAEWAEREIGVTQYYMKKIGFIDKENGNDKSFGKEKFATSLEDQMKSAAKELKTSVEEKTVSKHQKLEKL